MGMQAEFRAKGQENADQPFMIVADKNGVRFKGESPFLSEMHDLQVLAMTIDKAWKSHMMFKSDPLELPPDAEQK